MPRYRVSVPILSLSSIEITLALPSIVVRLSARCPSPGALHMMDAVLVVAGIGFFLAAIAYAVACDRL
jgi:hypothetical protein